MIETTVYIADISCLKDSNVFEALYRNLSKERQKKIDRLLLPEDRQRSLGAAVLLKQVLFLLGIPSFELSYGEKGKPFLKHEPGIFFNLSHSGDKVICAVSSAEIGCDIEKIRELEFDVAGRFFSPQEADMIKSAASDDEKNGLFFRLWTLKESFVKATGRGMMPGFFEVSLELIPGGAKTVESAGESYFFKSFSPEHGYQVSLCGKAEDVHVTTIIPLSIAV